MKDQTIISIKELLNKIESGKIDPKKGLELYKSLKNDTSIGDALQILYYTGVWKKSSAQSIRLDNDESPVIIFDTDETFYQLYKKDTSTKKVFLVTPNQAYQQSNAYRYEINPELSENYFDLIQDLYARSIIPEKIIYLWPKQLPLISPEDDISKYIAMSFDPIFFLTRALLKQRKKQNQNHGIQLLYIYQYHNNHMAAPFHSSISGFARSLRMEHPEVIYKTIAFNDLSQPKWVLNKSLQEFHMNSSAVDVRYHGDERHIKEFENINAAIPDPTSLPFVQKGVYLITGGLGGLGRIFAHYLARKCQANIVLTGRSDLSSEKKEQLKSIESAGAEVIYIKSDMSNDSDVNQLILEIKSRFGGINGIIHGAGTIHDALILKKNKADIDDVLAPKIRGSLNLDEATRKEDLDFFVLFSSTTSIMGNSGQTDYAYANSFMDHFAEIRDQLRKDGKRSGKSISINWPLWKNGGMTVPEQTHEWLEKTLGIYVLPDNLGLEAFEKAIATNLDQLIVFYGNSLKIQKLLMQEKPDKPSQDVPMEKEGDTRALIPDTKILISEVKQKLISIAIRLLKVDDEDIDIDAEMSDYGFDSISLTALINKINDTYNLELMPAIFFEHTTLESFAQHLCDHYTDNLLKIHQDAIQKSKSEDQQQTEIKKEIIQTIQISEPEETIQQPVITDQGAEDPIAIIGISAIMPGSTDLNDFWNHLNNGDDLVTKIPKDRWDFRACYGDPVKEPDKTDRIWGAFISDADKFDASFFHISPREAQLMDPQHRVFLEIVWKCIEDAGYKPSDFSGSKTGLFAGISSSDYYEHLLKLNVSPEVYTSTGTAFSILTNRISYLLDLKGPSEPLDTACSSSMYAVHRAIMAIKNDGCTTAIAGGVNLMLSPRNYIAFSKAGVLSSDGRCKTFDKKANGYVRGEGAGAILLKSLSNAIKDHDHIYGVIKAVSVNHGGHVSSLTVPNPNAQAELIVDAYEKAGVDPTHVSYIEAHGTGTVLGDSVEINGLKKAFKTLYEKKGLSFSNAQKHCGISSVKTNIGHLEPASGFAGLLKVILCMKYKRLPATVHFEEINPQIQLDDTPFYIVDQSQPWTPLTNNAGQTIPRIAGVSSFGYGGANAHLVIEEAKVINMPSPDDRTSHIIPLSAKNVERLRAYAKQLADFLDIHENDPLSQKSLTRIAYTLQTGRDPMDTRLVIITSNIHELKDKLIRFSHGKNDSADYYGEKSTHNKNKEWMIIDGEEGQAYLNSLLINKKINKLASLWVSGAQIDWHLLYTNEKPYRLPLPTYPFSRDRYWIKSPEDKQTEIMPKSSCQMEFFQYVWESSNIKEISSIDRKPVLIFGHDTINIESIKEGFDTQVIWVKGSDRFITTDQGYEIRIDHPDDYIQLLSSLSQNNCFPETLIHLWSIDTNHVNPLQNIVLTPFGNNLTNSYLNAGIYSIYYLVKAISNLRFDALRNILFFHHTDNIFSEAISGMSMSLKSIFPHFHLRTIQIEISEENHLLDMIKQEMGYSQLKRVAEEIRYEKDKRLIRKLRPLTLQNTAHLPIKENGIYLITGGIGGLGLIFARYLVEKFKAQLILTARSLPGKAQTEALENLRESGANILVFQGDVSDGDRMKAMIESVNKQLGPINGVIHAAGVSSTSNFIQKTQKDIETTLKPKIHGTIILDQVTQEQPLDFYVLFSSTSSVLGDFGQCDYAVANRFVDVFAKLRTTLVKKHQRKGQTISINWPLWREGGMQLSPETEAHYLKTSGTGFLAAEKGIELFEQILSNSQSQVIVLPASMNLPMHFNEINAQNLQNSQSIGLEVKDKKEAFTKESKALVTYLIPDLQKIAADIVMTEPHELDPNERLAYFGFDSISLIMLADKINGCFSINMMPSAFFDHTSISELSTYLIEKFDIQINEFYKDRISSRQTKPIETLSSPAHKMNQQKTIHPTITKSKTMDHQEPIAVIGMHGVFPQSSNLSIFWKHLASERDLITEIPRDRWRWEDYYTDPITGQDRPYMKWGGFIPNADKFDPLFFKISPREAQMTDPQQRVFIETVWKTVEDAGYSASNVSGKKVAVFAAVQFDDYQQLLFQNNLRNAQIATGNAHTMIANRISFIMNWHGPSETINTACSGSLISVHRAVRSLRSKECDMAIAGGVSLILYPGTMISTGQLGVLAPDGRCKPFDKAANGFVKGEASAALLLKPLSHAKKDGDHIYAIIKGSSVNHGGAAASLTAPSSKAQAELLMAAYDDACIHPNTLSYLELHGTGTELGDPVEIEGITTAFQKMADKETPDEIMQPKEKTSYCGIGSVKSNMGHAEPASGIAGMIKVILSMKHKTLPGTPHFKTLNPYIHLDNTPFYVVGRTRQWEVLTDQKGNPIPLRAGVSSFGFGGAYAHVILEESPDKSHSLPVHHYPSSTLIFLSAKNKERLKIYAQKMRDYLETTFKDEQPNDLQSKSLLSQIAYTLHSGREPMNERLAMVVTDISELKEKLSQYIQGQQDINNVFSGNIKTQDAGMGFFIEDSEGREFVKIISQKQKFDKLAQLWVSGIEIDSDVIYSDTRPERISLPTYPFAKERYWIPEIQTATDTLIPHQQSFKTFQAGLHPLLERNTSTLKEQQYTTTLNGHEFFLRDHIVTNQITFPGVAYVEMARAAGKAASEQEVYKLSNIVWSLPFTLSDPPKEISINLSPIKEGADFKVISKNADKTMNVHATGKLLWTTNEHIHKAEPKHVKDILNRCHKRLSHEACYQFFQTVHLDYGPCFRPIIEIFSNKNEAISCLELPSLLKTNFKNFVFHPTLADGALQTISALIMHQSPGEPHVPFVMGEVTLIKPLTEKCYAHVISDNQNVASGDVKKYHVDILSPDGNILVQMKNFSVRPLTQNTHMPSPLYFYPAWEQTEMQQSDISVDHPVLIFDHDDTRVKILQDLLNTKIILVTPGKNWQQESNQCFQINPNQSSDYRNLFSALLKEKHFPRYIIHLWSHDHFATDEDQVNEALNMSFYSMVHFVQTLFEQKFTDDIHLLYIYTATTDAPHPLYAALSGFIRTIALENTRLKCKTIVLPDLSQFVDIIKTELQTEDHEVSYHDQKRWIKKLNEDQSTEATNIEQLLKPNGVYLLTGGTGGLGLIIADYLIQKVNARLILTGRSELNQHQKDKIKSLEDKSARILYIQADISKRSHVENLVQQATSHFKEINGVIHAAGQISDAYITKKKIEALRSVLAPKVLGTIFLDDALKSEPLSFFVMFSSITSVMGNAGQSDYAYANSFMDHFAHLREKWRLNNQRHGKTLSINWPLWESGGMSINDQVRHLIEKTMGLLPLNSAQGCDAFTKALSKNYPQILIASGDKKKIRKSLHILPEKSEIVTKPTTKHSQSVLSTLQKQLASMASDILSIDIQDISINEDISEYGFDSINFTELANRINDTFQIEITPVIFYEYPSLEALSEKLLKDFTSRISSILGEDHTTSQPEDLHITTDAITQSTEVNHRFQNYSIDDTPEKVFEQISIAIIGMSGVMPQSRDLNTFWKHLEAGDDLISEVPSDRWDWKAYYGDPDLDGNKTRCKWGGFMPNVDQFDCLFFGISPREAELMDPQQRLFMQTVWKTIEDAGYRASDLSGSKTGLFVAVSSNDYFEMFNRMNMPIDPYFSTGMSHSVLANRISYLFNFHGPSEPVDTACSGSLIAIHRAVEAIRSGSCHMAIAGGVNVMLTPSLAIAFDKAGMLSKDGRCKTFDKKADGYVRGEGVGALLLKSLHQARADRDHIYAVIRGTAENHGGHATSLTAPNPNAQAELLISAYESAGVSPETITYIETHGTGTALGDPIEIKGLKKAFLKLFEQYRQTPKKNHCGLGSVKTNIGHLESAAGISGVLKVLLSMKNGKIPPTINFNTLNPYIELDDTPFYIASQLKDWQRLINDEGQTIPRRAGISSFGFGGANAHIILEEYHSARSVIKDKDTRIIVLSAQNDHDLRSYAKAMADFITDHPKKSLPCLADIAYTLQMGREPMKTRLAIVSATIEALNEKLTQFSNRETAIEDCYFNDFQTIQPGMDMLIDGEAGAAFIKIIMENMALNKIAQLWVTGVQIDWNLLYLNDQPVRVSLPSYPFSGDKYMIQPLESQKIESAMHISENETLNHFFHTDWVEVPVQIKKVEPNSYRSILLFDSNTSRQSALKEKLNADIICVKHGNNFKSDPEHHEYTINPNNESDYVDLLTELASHKNDPEALLHLWGMDDLADENQADTLNIEMMDYQLTTGIFSIYHLIQAVSEIQLTSLKRIVFLFKGNKESPNPFMEAVSGYSQSLGRVLPNLSLSTMLLSNYNEQNFPDLIAKELCFNSQISSEIYYDEEKRFVRKIKELKI
jgi:polyketide synthase PksN